MFAPLAVAVLLASPTVAGENLAAPGAGDKASTDGTQAAAPASDLPDVVINQRPIHAVPNDDVVPPPAPVTLKERDGRDVALHAPPPRHSARSRPVVTTIAPIEGAARADEALTLSVLGRPVRLFGIKPAAAGEHCAVAGEGADQPCVEAARQALAARLKQDAFVSCTMPRGQRARPAAAICVDSRGVDLGEFLVEQGLALADPTQSYEYAGAQDRARAARRGLWRAR